MFIASILCLCFWPFVPSPGAAIAFVVVFGAFSGAVIGLPPASVFSIVELDPNADKARLGQWTGSSPFINSSPLLHNSDGPAGMMYTVAAVPALLGPVIGGQLVRAHGFLAIQLFCGACLLAGSVCIALAHMCAQHGSAAAAMTRYREKLSSSNVASRVTLAVSDARSWRSGEARGTSALNTPWASRPGSPGSPGSGRVGGRGGIAGS